MDTTLTLALIIDLYSQVSQLTGENEHLRQVLAQNGPTEDHSPIPEHQPEVA